MKYFSVFDLADWSARWVGVVLLGPLHWFQCVRQAQLSTTKAFARKQIFEPRYATFASPSDVGIVRAEPPSTTQTHADKHTAAPNHEHAQKDIYQGGGPEGKQIQGFVAVESFFFIIVCREYRVDPHVAWRWRDRRVGEEIEGKGDNPFEYMMGWFCGFLGTSP